jgi:hypothetical protein
MPVKSLLTISCVFVCLIALLIPGILVADERTLDRSGFAAVGQNTWLPLTDFEQRIVQRLNEVQSPTPEDLLALYLIASGDVRQESQFNVVMNELQQFWSQHEHLLQMTDEWQRGRELLRAMHRYFFYPDSDSFPQHRYDADQSALSEIFRSKIYNCISSALLYIVLAEQAKLTAYGVLMPSHAFVQLKFQDGTVVEVETTTADGFDVIRDEQFFLSSAQQWFSDRSLVVASLADYEQRQIISAAHLGYENMWTQHVREDRMPYSDRLRLSELRGLLQPDSIDAQHNRLIYYYRESNYLLGAGHSQLYAMLFAQIEPLLAVFSGAEIFSASYYLDPDTMLPLLLMQARRAEWLVSVGEQAKGLDLAREIVSGVPEQLRDAEVIRGTAFTAIATAVRQQLQLDDFEIARQTLDSFGAACADDWQCLQVMEEVYAHEGGRLWEQRDWHGVVRLYEQYLVLDTGSNNVTVFTGNIEAALLNSSEQYWRDEERDEAIAVLELCVIRYQQAQRCADRLSEMRALHN